MTQITTTIDKNNKTVLWYLEDREYTSLAALLTKESMVFDNDASKIIVTMTSTMSYTVVANYYYNVFYNNRTGLITLTGFHGVYTDLPYTNFVEFGNKYINIAKEHGCVAKFTKKYYVKSFLNNCNVLDGDFI